MRNELDIPFRAATAASILLTAAACSPQEQKTDSQTAFVLDEEFISKMPAKTTAEQDLRSAAQLELDSIKENCNSIPGYIPGSEFVWHVNFGKEDAYRYAFCQAKTDGNMKYTMVVAYNENGKNTESIMKPLEFKKTIIGTKIYGYYDDQGKERDILKKSIDGGASSYDISGNEDLLTLQDRTNADAVISLFSLGVTPVYAMAPDTETPTLTQLPTETPTPEATAMITVTPTPEATPTQEPSATPEVRQFPICQIENFRDCPLDLEKDIYSGDYDRWLNTQKKPFDLSKMRHVIWAYYPGLGYIQPDFSTAPNFKVPGTESFYRDITAGHLVYEEGGKKYEYIVMPTLYYEWSTGESFWVKTVYSMFTKPSGKPLSKEIEALVLDDWRKKMKITLINTTGTSFLYSFPDPLVSKTFQKYPDIEERFKKFTYGDSGDMSVLSDPGMILLTDILTSRLHWYE